MKVIATKFNVVYHLNKIINRSINPDIKGHLLDDLILNEATYLNDYVIEQCYYLIEFLNDPETFIHKHGKCWIDTQSYYKETRPAFHKYDNCGRLNAPFVNIEIPKRLRNHEDAVRMIRTTSSEILEEGQYKTQCQSLCDELNAAFHFEPRVTVDEFTRIEKETGENLSLENDINTIIQEIKNLHCKTLKHLKKNPHLFNYKNDKYIMPTYEEFLKNYSAAPSQKRFSYLYHRTFNDLAYFRKYLLKPIERRLNYYILGKFNKEVKFERTILEILGFQPCGNCFKPDFGFHFEFEPKEEVLAY